MRLGLGTVQFGLDYGITNPVGQTPLAEVRRILALALRHDIRLLDTAAGYGESEAVLGECLGDDRQFRVVTKISAARVEDRLKSSLERLRQPSVYGVLAHDPAELVGPDAERFFAGLLALKASGLTRKIGISVYGAREIDAVLERFEIDLVQLPLSVLDQRLVRSGHLQALHESGVEVHARSVFLQGLVLAGANALPSRLASLEPMLRELHETAREQGVSAAAVALAFVCRLTQVDQIIVGVNQARQLVELIEAYHAPVDSGIDFSAFAVDDEHLVNPHRWSDAN